MKDSMNNGFVEQGEAFSIGTLIYARLRRVTGRLIDVLYLMENRLYAQHVVDLALAANDAELERQAGRLSSLLERENKINPMHEANTAEMNEFEAEKLFVEQHGVTEEEIYKAQVSHHYIGALR